MNNEFFFLKKILLLKCWEYEFVIEYLYGNVED